MNNPDRFSPTTIYQLVTSLKSFAVFLPKVEKGGGRHKNNVRATLFFNVYLGTIL